MRKILFLFLFFTFLSGCSAIRINFWKTKSLRQVSLKPIGVAVDSKLISQNPIYREVVLREFNSITSENALKMEIIHPERSVFDFSQVDVLLALADANKLRFRAHPLIWHRQLPAWLGEVKVKEFEKVFDAHISSLVKHCKAKAYSWDVVNEAFLRNGDYRPNIWFVAIGPSYIEKAFRIAHQHDPRAKLFYNDFQIEKVGPKFNAVYKMLKELKDKGVPIDGIGLQAHLGINYNVRRDELSEVIKRFSDLGLEVEITELDVAIPTNDSNQQALKMQAATYQMIANVCNQFASCRGITLWGLDDSHSWVPKEFPGLGQAMLFDDSLQPKPIYTIFKNSLAAHE